jgi:hypothetical protein
VDIKICAELKILYCGSFFKNFKILFSPLPALLPWILRFVLNLKFYIVLRDQTEIHINEKCPCFYLKYMQTKEKRNIFVIAVIFIETHEVDQSPGGLHDGRTR